MKISLSNIIRELESTGTFAFTKGELEKKGLKGLALKAALRRAKIKGILASPHKGIYVIVPTEYQKLGAPPPDWYIDFWMKCLNKTYYIALLSACSFYGVSPQAIQETQVISNDKPGSKLVGKHRVRFFYKKEIKNVPINKKVVKTGYAKISTPAATAIDLVRYAEKVGGIGFVSDLIKDLSSKITPHDLKLCLSVSKNEIQVLQRLGFLFEHHRNEVLAKIVESRILLNNKNLKKINLSQAKDISKDYEKNSRWNVIINVDLENEQ